MSTTTVKASNVYLVVPSAVYENVPVQLEAYKVEGVDGEETRYQTFQEAYPNARYSVEWKNQEGEV